MEALGGQIFKLRQTDQNNHIIPVRNKGKIETNIYKATIQSIRTDVEMEFIRSDLNEPQIIKLDYMYYTPMSFPLWPFDEGAYIFRPMWPTKQASRYNFMRFYESYEGKVVSQFRLYGDQLDTIITGNELTDFVEIETELKGLNWDIYGMDVILRITNDNIKNNKTFYTDSM